MATVEVTLRKASQVGTEGSVRYKFLTTMMAQLSDENVLVPCTQESVKATYTEI